MEIPIASVKHISRNFRFGPQPRGMIPPCRSNQGDYPGVAQIRRLQALGGFSNEYRSECTASNAMGQNEVTQFRDGRTIT